ncbi:MAG: formate--tetrahydrofolate ligase [Chlamydiia bacterium]|nr:formate--tetrahydrofolate ligase [Chlamydiia bacterium]
MSKLRTYTKLPKLTSDLEIAQQAVLKPIAEIAAPLGLGQDDLFSYGPHVAKVTEAAVSRARQNPRGRLILVTAMTATRAGEGKTVTTIGLGQALGRMGHKHLVCVREPSLGPTFGFKGGATGGGRAQVLPMESINLHFTGDIHAVGIAHNLLAAMIDNHIFHGNELGIDPKQIVWRRVIDLCDRQLRHCDTGLGTRFDGVPRKTGFDITAASEVMAILALAEDLADLENRLGRIVVAYREDGTAVYARELDCVPALCALLKDALQPNLVQTIEHTPVLVHCGPFANISHGCNSVRATKLGLHLADYVVTEAGFAADLGAEKFLNIKCRQAGIWPDAAVLVVSCRALKLHGGVEFEDVGMENLEACKRGLDNVRVHIENLGALGVPVVVALNRFPSDTDAELDLVQDWCEEQGHPHALSEVAALGGEGGEELAKAVLSIMDQGRGQAQYLYSPDQPIAEKMQALASQIYRAQGVDYSEEAQGDIKRLEQLGLDHLPICTAKTQLSISDQPKILGAPGDYRLKVQRVGLSNGAGFLVVQTGKILLMPGMGKETGAHRIGIAADGRLTGLA